MLHRRIQPLSLLFQPLLGLRRLPALRRHLGDCSLYLPDLLLQFLHGDDLAPPEERDQTSLLRLQLPYLPVEYLQLVVGVQVVDLQVEVPGFHRIPDPLRVLDQVLGQVPDKGFYRREIDASEPAALVVAGVCAAGTVVRLPPVVTMLDPMILFGTAVELASAPLTVQNVLEEVTPGRRFAAWIPPTLQLAMNQGEFLVGHYRLYRDLHPGEAGLAGNHRVG